MSASILSRTISGTADKRLVLSNSPAARLWSLGTNWDQLRIGCRLTLNDTLSGDITGTPLLAIGMCAGTTNKFGDESTDHFVGIKSYASSWTRTAGPPEYYYVSDFRAVKRIGTTDTVSGTTLGAGYLVGTPASNRCGFLVEITKGTSWSINAVVPDSGAHAQADKSLATLQSAMDGLTTLSGAATALGYAALSAQTLTVDEDTDGYLDSVCLFWDRTVVTVEISEVLLTKIA